MILENIGNPKDEHVPHPTAYYIQYSPVRQVVHDKDRKRTGNPEP